MSELELLGELTAELERGLAQNKLATYEPYKFQQEFHAAGRDNPERMLMAANRTGKTMSAAIEVTYHLTGLYPDWWKGKVFESPTLCWTGSTTNETSKDIVQKELIGGLGEDLGTGWVPKSLIVGKPTTRQAGVKNVVDSFKVRHVSGGLSECVLKTYEQGWQKWQGAAPDVVWPDEEPDDYMIFSEAQTRILTSGGILLVTFTPLLGLTDLVQHFQEGGKGIFLLGATWEDAPHLPKDERDRLAASYRAHERPARTKGIPMMGEGAVFPVPEEDIMFNLSDWPGGIPRYFARMKGCDFGMDHPAAGSEIAWDRDQDIIYVIDCYRKAQEKAPYHAAWFNKANRRIPVAWPHDGMNRETVGGDKLADTYRKHGANMMGKSARYRKSPGQKEDKGGPQPVEPIVDEVLERMLTGRFKVASHLNGWFEEMRSYHRKDGRIVARRDDILKATFYAVMMKRYAVTASEYRPNAYAGPLVPVSSTRLQ